MKILLFGGRGQLGYEIKTRAQDLNFEIVAPVSSEVDVGNLAQVRFLVSQMQPDIIINAAAYTAVDKAEIERELCMRINRDGAGHVARAAAETKRRLIFISTDYVFDGTRGVLLKESDDVAPVNVYGESKLAGEREVQKFLGDDALILRTSSLHGQRGVNFVAGMLSLFLSRPEVRVVEDQRMSPTWAGWLAEVILDLSRHQVGGILHACGQGVVSWYDFARAIHEWSNSPRTARIIPITTAEFGRPARRPPFSALDCTKLTSIVGRPPVSWQDGLKMHLKEVGALRAEI